jgi:hypothetical protein
VAQLFSLGTLASEHDEDTKHTVHLTGGRPEGDVVGFHRADGSILDYSSGDLPGDVVIRFEGQRLLGCDGYCDCHISYRYGRLAYTISVGALLSRVA